MRRVSALGSRTGPRGSLQSQRFLGACCRTQEETGLLVGFCFALYFAQWCRLSFGKWLLQLKNFEKTTLNPVHSFSWDGFPWPPAARQEEPPTPCLLGGWSAPWKVDAGVRRGAISTRSWWHLTELWGAQRSLSATLPSLLAKEQEFPYPFRSRKRTPRPGGRPQLGDSRVPALKPAIGVFSSSRNSLRLSHVRMPPARRDSRGLVSGSCGDTSGEC